MTDYERDDYPVNREDDGEDYGSVVVPDRNTLRYSPTTASTSATTVVLTSPSVPAARRFQTTEENRRGAMSKKTTGSSSKASSSKVQRKLEMVRLEEEGLRARVDMQQTLLRLNDLEKKKLELEDELEDEDEDGTVNALSNDDGDNRTPNWVEQAIRNKFPPSPEGRRYEERKMESPPPPYPQSEK